MSARRFVNEGARGDDHPAYPAVEAPAFADGTRQVEVVTGMRLRTLAEIKAHALEEDPYEACGFVVRVGGQRERVVRAENRAHSPDRRFLIAPGDLYDALQMGTVAAVYHSHTGDRTAQPTQPDLYGMEALKIPYVIYAVERNEWTFTRPKGYEPPLEGREWADGVQDCYTLVVDYYRGLRRCTKCEAWSHPELTRGRCAECRGVLDRDARCDVQPPVVYREDYWWKRRTGEGTPQYDFWRDLYAEAGFVRVPVETARRHDLLVMQWPEEQVPHHGAVHLGGGEIVHHLHEKLSSRESYPGRMRYDRKTVLVLRRREWVREGDAWRP